MLPEHYLCVPFLPRLDAEICLAYSSNIIKTRLRSVEVACQVQPFCYTNIVIESFFYTDEPISNGGQKQGTKQHH